MKNLLFAAAVVMAISFASSTAKADHRRHRGSYHHYVPRHVVPHYHVPHHAYRYAPVYPRHYSAYPPYHYRYGHHLNYHYARPGYGSGFGVSGRNFSFYLGF